MDKSVQHPAVPTALVSVALLLASGSLLALEPAPIRFGILDIVPTLDTDYTHTDNMFLSSTTRQSSGYLLVTPRVSATATNGVDRYSATLEVQNGNYTATREDDYTDWKLSGDVAMELNARNLINVHGEFFNTHEKRGTGFSQGDVFTPIPDTFNATTLRGSYQLGSRESRGRLVMDASFYAKDYTNNYATTLVRNRDDFGWGSTFYLGTLPRTDILLQYRQRAIDYRVDPAATPGTADTLDSDEQYLYTGLTWEATGKTTGTLKLGYGQKDFEDPDRPDSSGPSWEADIRWEPRTYSVVTVTTGRVFGEQSGVGSGVDSRTWSVDWRHDWSGQLTSTVAGSIADDSYLNSARKDKIRGMSARMDYAFDSWLDVFVSASHDERESLTDRFDYSQNTIRFGFAASL